MLGAMSFIGILLMLGVLAGYVLRKQFIVFSFLQNSRKALILFGVGAFFALGNWLFFYSRFGHQYYLVYPTGGWSQRHLLRTGKSNGFHGGHRFESPGRELS